jgi:uncharacterized membrane-anchored protein
MITLMGWIIITVTFAAISLGLLFPCYRIARRHFPNSRKVRWTYCGAAAVGAMVLWILIPILVHTLAPRF